jgi:acetylornithine deacetylase/succinyl-diaminopimelate desuccinylase-like protein
MRRWLRPSLEIVGVGGGHTGEGMRGVVPSKAKAKVMCRLVADQNATAVLEAFQRHVSMHAPSHAHFNFRAAAQQGRLVTEPYRMPKDSLGNRAAAKVLPSPSHVVAYTKQRSSQRQTSSRHIVAHTEAFCQHHSAKHDSAVSGLRPIKNWGEAVKVMAGCGSGCTKDDQSKQPSLPA